MNIENRCALIIVIRNSTPIHTQKVGETRLWQGHLHMQLQKHLLSQRRHIIRGTGRGRGIRFSLGGGWGRHEWAGRVGRGPQCEIEGAPPGRGKPARGNWNWYASLLLLLLQKQRLEQPKWPTFHKLWEVYCYLHQTESARLIEILRLYE